MQHSYSTSNTAARQLKENLLHDGVFDCNALRESTCGTENETETPKLQKRHHSRQTPQSIQREFRQTSSDAPNYPQLLPGTEGEPLQADFAARRLSPRSKANQADLPSNAGRHHLLGFDGARDEDDDGDGASAKRKRTEAPVQATGGASAVVKEIISKLIAAGVPLPSIEASMARLQARPVWNKAYGEYADHIGLSERDASHETKNALTECQLFMQGSHGADVNESEYYIALKRLLDSGRPIMRNIDSEGNENTSITPKQPDAGVSGTEGMESAAVVRRLLSTQLAMRGFRRRVPCKMDCGVAPHEPSGCFTFPGILDSTCSNCIMAQSTLSQPVCGVSSRWILHVDGDITLHLQDRDRGPCELYQSKRLTHIHFGKHSILKTAKGLAEAEGEVVALLYQLREMRSRVEHEESLILGDELAGKPFFPDTVSSAPTTSGASSASARASAMQQVTNQAGPREHPTKKSRAIRREKKQTPASRAGKTSANRALSKEVVGTDDDKTDDEGDRDMVMRDPAIIGDSSNNPLEEFQLDMEKRLNVKLADPSPKPLESRFILDTDDLMDGMSAEDASNA